MKSHRLYERPPFNASVSANVAVPDGYSEHRERRAVARREVRQALQLHGFDLSRRNAPSPRPARTRVASSSGVSGARARRRRKQRAVASRARSAARDLAEPYDGHALQPMRPVVGELGLAS